MPLPVIAKPTSTTCHAQTLAAGAPRIEAFDAKTKDEADDTGLDLVNDAVFEQLPVETAPTSTTRHAQTLAAGHGSKQSYFCLPFSHCVRI